MQPLPPCRLLVDLFAGASAPISTAACARRLDRILPLDLLHGVGFDMSNDIQFSGLCQLASSGLVGAMIAAPPCSSFSRARLRLGGPRPVRTPEHPAGLPHLSFLIASVRSWTPLPCCTPALGRPFRLLRLAEGSFSSRTRPQASSGLTRLSKIGCPSMRLFLYMSLPAHMASTLPKPGSSGRITLMSRHLRLFACMARAFTHHLLANAFRMVVLHRATLLSRRLASAIVSTCEPSLSVVTARFTLRSGGSYFRLAFPGPFAPIVLRMAPVHAVPPSGIGLASQTA